MSTPEMTADVLVIGGGMGGLTAAAAARERGASVIVVEIGEDTGGSAAMSAGLVWTAQDIEQFRREDPLGHVERFRIVREGLEESIDWVAGLGVDVAGPVRCLSDVRLGTHIDVVDYLTRCRKRVEQHGDSWVFLGTATEQLLRDGERVTGALVRNLATGDRAEILARATVLATGGFQGNVELLRRYAVPGAGALVLRSNSNSRGAGLVLGLEAGGATTARMDTFYGHLMPYPWPNLRSSDHRSFAQKQSDHGLLLDRSGFRFVDESLGDQRSNLATASRGTALLLIDEQIRRTSLGDFDPMREAGPRGAHFASGPSVESVAAAAGEWGFDGEQIAKTVAEFNSDVEGSPDRLAIPRTLNRRPLVEPPFAVLEVQTGITFTFGGLESDADCRVLRPDSGVVDGLFVVGVDGGGLNVEGYTGGLSRALVSGRRAAAASLVPPNGPAVAGA